MTPEPEAPASARTLRSIVGVVVVLALAFLFMAGFKSWHDLAAARAREALLDRRVEATRERIDTLERRIRRIKEDPATLERLAREELGLVKPGDLVILLPEEPDPGAPTAPRP